MFGRKFVSMARKSGRHLIEKSGPLGPRWYWQPSTQLRAEGWRAQRLDAMDLPAAMAAAESLNQEVDAWRQGLPAPHAPAAIARTRRNQAAPGSVGALIRDYKGSRWWSGLAPRTQRDYAWCLDLIGAWAADMPARAITPPAVQAFYEGQLRQVTGKGKARVVIERPAKAAAAVRVLRLLLQVGVRLGYLKDNPASRPGIGLTRQREPVLWSQAAVRHMAATADRLGWRSIGTAILLNEWLGQRVEDLLGIRAWSLEQGAIVLRQGKTGRLVSLPVHLVPHLVERLNGEAARPGGVQSLTHLLTHDRTGQPWKLFTFSHTFADVREEAARTMPACAGLIFRELRHTMVTRQHEAGTDNLGIASLSGHTPGSVQAILDKHYLIRTSEAAEHAFRRRLAKEGE